MRTLSKKVGTTAECVAYFPFDSSVSQSSCKDHAEAHGGLRRIVGGRPLFNSTPSANPTLTRAIAPLGMVLRVWSRFLQRSPSKLYNLKVDQARGDLSGNRILGKQPWRLGDNLLGSHLG